MMMKRLSNQHRLWLLGLLLAATWLYTWGLQRNLPYLSEADESVFVERAVVMISTGDWNPRWFGHPGSTIFYPLIAIYQLWYFLYGAAMPDLATWFATEAWLFYYLARLLSVAYTLLAIPLTYQVGRRVFNTTTGLVGATFLVSYPNILFHIKSVRTDGVGMTFALLAVWACLEVYRQPTLRHQIVAGITLGLGIASRYFLVLFTPLLLWLNWSTWRSNRQVGQITGRAQLLTLTVALLTIGFSFAFSTPYFILDFPTAWHGLVVEGRNTHPGADGLSPLANFLWYCNQIARSEYRAIQLLFALIGLFTIMRQRRLLALSVGGMILVFLAGISVSPLHWLRWALPILPLAALVSAYGLVSSVGWLTQTGTAVLRQLLLLSLMGAAMAAPGLRSLQLSIQDANPSTRLAARFWLLQHLAADARLIQEPYTTLLVADPRVTNTGLSLGTDHTLTDYKRAGYTHLVISSAMYNRFRAEPTRYPSEVAFYQSLLDQSTPLVTFSATWVQGGPNLHIYALSGQP